MSDPVRLSRGGDGAPPELSQLLADARGDVPSAAQLERLAARLPLAGPIPPPATGAGSAGSGAAKVIVGLAVAGAIVGGGVWLRSSGSPAPPAPAPTVTATHAQDPEPAAVAEPPAPAPAAPSSEGAADPPDNVQPKPVAQPSEATLLRRAQAALHRDPARALALTQEHRRRFPKGALAQEREVIAIEALSRLGRSGEAAKRAKTFENSYPGSAHQRKVETTVEEGQR